MTQELFGLLLGVQRRGWQVDVTQVGDDTRIVLYDPVREAETFFAWTRCNAAAGLARLRRWCERNGVVPAGVDEPEPVDDALTVALA